MKLRRYMLGGIALLLPLAISAQESTGAQQLTVALFAARHLDDITLVPLTSRASMRACATCVTTPVRLPIHLSLQNGEVQSSTGRHAAAFSLEGSFRVEAGNTTERSSPDDSLAEASGVWQVRPSEKGLEVLLTLPSERYVALALNGEAAVDEPGESLLAMAVLMRTFALTNATRHASQGFNLCDSTHCQALRFGKIRPAVQQAEKETLGETLWFGSHRAQVFYSQDCGGVTEDAASVWPGAHLPYLASHADPYCLRRSAAQWHTDIPASQLLAIAKDQGWRFPPRMEYIRVTRRTSSGRASLLEVDGAGVHASVSADSLRFAIDRAMGWNQMRSDWYTVSLSNGTLHFAGRGFGHGVGLCQAGAYAMASGGQSSAAILNFYFPGTQLRISPEDTGWKTVEGAGWTLRTVDSSRALLQAGNIAWEGAKTVFPPQAPVHPVVHAMPNIELFRQATNEPGWILASEQEGEIFLQPAAVLQAHAPIASTLRHEFLHILVEEEAGANTPLWLREGLVEALDGEPSRSTNGIPLATLANIDRMLAGGGSQRASQSAHNAAHSLVTSLISRYGLTTVRSWLHHGVPVEVVRDLSQHSLHFPRAQDTTRSARP